MTDAVEVGRTRTVDATVGHQRNLVVNVLSDGQPVQRVTKYRSIVKFSPPIQLTSVRFLIMPILPQGTEH